MEQDRAILLLGPEAILSDHQPKKELKNELKSYIHADLSDLLGPEKINEARCIVFFFSGLPKELLVFYIRFRFHWSQS